MPAQWATLLLQPPDTQAAFPAPHSSQLQADIHFQPAGPLY
jgi:hypothetical protein